MAWAREAAVCGQHSEFRVSQLSQSLPSFLLLKLQRSKDQLSRPFAVLVLLGGQGLPLSMSFCPQLSLSCAPGSLSQLL